MHFLSCRVIWPNIAIFSCLWHVKKTWQKQACNKINDPTLHSNVLQELKNIMYDKDGPSGVGAKMWAMSRPQYITNKYPTTNAFWKYMEENW